MEDDRDDEEDDNDIIQVLEPNDLNIQKTQSLNEKLRVVEVEAKVHIEKPKKNQKLSMLHFVVEGRCNSKQDISISAIKY